VGALPAEKIREFLDKHVPGEGEIVSELETLEAEQLAESGDTETALAKLEDALAKDPGNDEARFDLIKLLLAEGALEGAQAIFAPIADRATGLLAEQRVNAFGRYIDALASARQGRSPAELSAAIEGNKRDFTARFELAQIFFASGHFTEAMDELLEIVMRDKGWNDELARKTYVAILEVMSKPQPKPIPPKAAAATGAAEGKPQLEIAGKVAVTANDPVVDKYRRKLSSALF
ncbi:MAG: tetratricopeptide repeat protein, partial [Burkholderiaceae bacterium]